MKFKIQQKIIFQQFCIFKISKTELLFSTGRNVGDILIVSVDKISQHKAAAQ